MFKTSFYGIEFKNPVVGTSGTFGSGGEYENFTDLSKLGGISTEGLAIKAKDGNTGLRTYETPSGVMNSIGLQNPSAQEFINRDLGYMLSLDTVTIANIGGSDIESYIEAIELISSADIKVIELNISCPNVKGGGVASGIKYDIAQDVISEVRKHTDRILMVKLFPNANDIVEVTKTCENSGADAISLVNTFNVLAVSVNKKEAVPDNITAGLSGPCIKPIALRMCRDVCKNVRIPVCGMGKMQDYKDALESIIVGYHLVQVGTANFVSPDVMVEIVSGMENYLKGNGLKSIEEVKNII